MMDFSRIYSVAKTSALEAGQVLSEGFRTDFKISKKGSIDLVTEMDLEAERVILTRIIAEFPDHQILAEEEGMRSGTSPYKWIIDPLDGTTNYAHGYGFFCVSIALEVEDELVLGIVYDPIAKEMFSAQKGQGAFLNDRPIRVSEERKLIDSLFCTGFSYTQSEIQKNLQLFNRLIFQSRSVRRDGSAALDLCYVACGRFDGFWELSLNPWDVAAGKLIIEEAGGLVTVFNGSDCTVYDREILASNPGIHSQLVDLLQDVKSSD